MAKNRIKVCWLLLLVLMYTASVLMSVGESYARYDNTVTGSVLVESRESGITSNCLVTEKDAPLTVLVGELSLYKPSTVSFWLKSSGASAVGNLAWSVSDPDHLKYLDITMKSGLDVIDPNMEIELLQDVYMDISMTLTPTEIARNTEHEMLKINVLVTWGSEMWGTFQVVLPEVKGEEEDSEDPEQIQQEESGENSTVPEETTAITETTSEEIIVQPAAMTTAADGDLTEPAQTTAENNTDNTEETETTDPTDNTDTTDSTTEPVTEPSTEAATEPSTEAATEPSTEAATEPSTEATEPSGEEEEEEAEEEEPIRLNTLSSFDPAEMLPVSIAVTPDVTAVRLGLLVAEDAEAEDPENPVMVWEPFPDYTKFSLNEGQSYYMMYDGYIAEFALQEETALSLLLDFSHAELAEEEKLILAMEAYAGEELLRSCQMETAADAQGSFQTMMRPLAEPAQTVQEAETTGEEETETEPAAQAAPRPGNILSQNNTLEFSLPMDWLDADVSYSVEILTMTESQTLEYQPVTLSAQGLRARYIDYDLTHQLVLQIGEYLPQAGTYRINMKWSYEGICYAHTQTTFFINYSAKTNYTLGG